MKTKLDLESGTAKGYVSVDLAFHQCERIRDVLIEQNITPIDQGHFHSTIAYDREVNGSCLEIEIDPTKIYEGEVVAIELLGPIKDGKQSALAFVLKSDQLREEHFKWMAVGFDHGWDDYIPHMSVAYDIDVEEGERMKEILKPFIGETFYFDNLSAEPVQ
ncbi:hypothetical protein [Vibrio phage phiKT1028]|nr:hypothetical protein [Vibrio phage phiKT1028]